MLEPLQDCTPYLQSHVACRLVNARMSGEDSLQVPEILQYAIGRLPRLLTACCPRQKRGQRPRRLRLSLATPKNSETVARGKLQFQQGPLRGLQGLPFMDFQDQLPLPSPTWFSEPLEVETRQCLCLHVAAALSHVSEAEAFVRHNAHDCFYPHHEKDSVRADVLARIAAPGSARFSVRPC